MGLNLTLFFSFRILVVILLCQHISLLIAIEFSISLNINSSSLSGLHSTFIEVIGIQHESVYTSFRQKQLKTFGNNFLIFFSVRLLSVLHGHLVFSSPPQRPMISDFEGFSIPDVIHYIYFPILILEKEPVFPFLMFSAK